MSEGHNLPRLRRIFVLNALRCSVALFCLVLFPKPSFADLTWLKTATSCDMFAKGLASFVAGLGNMETLEPDQREELVIVLQEACGERLRGCQFEICRGVNDPPATPEAATFPSPVPEVSLPPVPGETLPNAVVVITPVPQLSSSPEYAAQTGNIKPGAIVTDPLAWLEQTLTCEELVEQIQVRYSVLGKFSELPVDKKAELRKVLDVSCSERFANCNFKSCAKPEATPTPEKGKGKKGSQKQSTPTPKPTPTVDTEAADTRAQAQQEFKRIYGELLARRKMMIELAIKSEKEKKLAWERLSNPDEIQELEARREAAKERERAGKDELDSDKMTEYLEAPFKRKEEKAKEARQQATGGESNSSQKPIVPTPRPTKKVRSSPAESGTNEPVRKSNGKTSMPPVMPF